MEKTHCGRMDHGGCALLVGVKANRIVRIKGDLDGYLNNGIPVTRGGSQQSAYHPDRRYPAQTKRQGVRANGRKSPGMRPDEIANSCFNKSQYGARAVGFGVGMPKGLEHFVLIRLANLFGSPNVIASQDVCHAPREVSGIHTCGFYPVADLHNPTNLVVAWGSTLLDTNEEGQISTLTLQHQKWSQTDGYRPASYPPG